MIGVAVSTTFGANSGGRSGKFFKIASCSEVVVVTTVASDETLLPT